MYTVIHLLFNEAFSTRSPPCHGPCAVHNMQYTLPLKIFQTPPTHAWAESVVYIVHTSSSGPLRRVTTFRPRKA